MAKFNDLTGKLFGRLTAVERLPPHGKTQHRCGLASASAVERR